MTTAAAPPVEAFAHSADVALDRDAAVTVELHFLPPSSNPKASAWLLLHAIPVTASLTTVLMRLLEAQSNVTQQQQQQQAATEADGSVTATVTSEEPLNPSRPPGCCVDLVRVGYVVSEIHAYCLLLKCSTAACAAALKGTLERGAALGHATPVEFVVDGPVVLRRHCAAMGSNGETSVREQGTEQGSYDESRLTLAQAALYGAVDVDVAASLLSPPMTTGGDGSGDPCDASRGSSSPAPPRQRHGSPRQPILAASADPSPTASPHMGPAATLAAEEAPTPPSQHTPLMPAAAASGSAAPLTPSLGPTHLGGIYCGTSEEHCSICQVEPLGAHPCVITLCYHVYHLSCYAKLASAECPLCRFSLYNLLSDAKCEHCGTYEDLWVCLLCGHVGCGRGRRNHAHAHFDETGHSTSLQCSTNRIWNESCRMFLNQEVALVLGEIDEAHWGGKPLHKIDDDALWLMSASEVDAHDAELQAALNESREEAVQAFYAGTLHSLVKEQAAWYERQERALVEAVGRRRRTRSRQREQQGQSRAANEELVGSDEVMVPAAPDTVVLLTALVYEEQADRRSIASAYIEAVRQTLTHAALTMRGILSRQRKRQEELRELVLLQSHQNNGLLSTLARLRQRIKEAEAKGVVDCESKKAKQAELEKQVSDALSRLTS